MILHVVLKVKFRAFGITFGTVDKSWDLALPVQLPGASGGNLLAFSERGVTLTISAIPARA